MTTEQRNTLTKLVSDMRSRAARVGPMHAWWEDIMDAEAFLHIDDRFATSKKADEWIAEFRRGHYLHNNPVSEAAQPPSL